MENAKTDQIMWKNESYQQPDGSWKDAYGGPHQQNDQYARNHLVTTAGVVRCRFELFIRWPDSAGRKMNPFTQRGDKYEKEDGAKMFRFLLQYFINKHQEWRMAELYDNTHPLDDPRRIVLAMRPKTGNVQLDKELVTLDLWERTVHHRLRDYGPIIKDFPLPEWLKKTIIP